MSGFDGLIGKFAASVMERRNREAEVEAIEILNPGHTDSIVVLGFGPGIGVSLLAKRLDGGVICGVDPSLVMVERAQKNVENGLKRATIDLRIGTADALDFESAPFDGALAVNSLQLFDPLGPSLGEIQRVLKPRGKFVSVTHGWAIEKHAESVDLWASMLKDVASKVGFKEISWRRGRSEKGTAVVVQMMT
jgi:ubiquinone/menaquinone biosynthesis C-methylase UbiE